MPWKLIEIDDDGEIVEQDQSEYLEEEPLDDTELVGLMVLVRDHMGEPSNDSNIYFRAMRKLWPATRKATLRQNS